MANIRRSALIAGMACLTAIAGCDAKEKGMDKLSEIPSNIKQQLAFTCTQERDHIPPRNPEADQLYKRARWLAKNNVLKQDPSVYPNIERLLRIATVYGHDKANLELRDMLEKAQAVSPDPVNEIIDLVQNLIARGVPSGFYSMGWYLEHGYGVRADRELAFKYYRKSADLGSPEGQYLVGDLLADPSKNGLDIAYIGLGMWACAASQRHALAANKLAVHEQAETKYTEALGHFQISTAEGLAAAASSLSNAFSTKDHADPVWGLGQVVDAERQARYYKISSFLSDYDYLNATVPELDQIVPLPPTKLPAWSGKFRWLEEHNANVPPALPTEDRIAAMARAKSLDPKTGRPLQPGSG